MGAELPRGEQFFDQRQDARKGFGKRSVADFFTVDANAFVDFIEVRRSVQTRSETGMTQDRFQECGGRAFPIGPCNVGGGICPFWAPQTLGENGDIFKVEFGRSGLRGRGQFPAKREQIADRRFVIHFSPGAGRGS